MSTVTDRGVVPEWTLADRIRKAREHAGLSQQQLADQLTVARQSVGSWESGRRPLRVMVREIARITGVDPDWLGGDGGVLPRLDSNQQPTGCRPDRSTAGYTPAQPDHWVHEFRRQLEGHSSVTS